MTCSTCKGDGQVVVDERSDYRTKGTRASHETIGLALHSKSHKNVNNADDADTICV